MYKKIIISFEGIEASGKSTHIKNVSNYLKLNKYKYVQFREPGGSRSAEKIRKLILGKQNNFNKKTDLFLYLASRSENFEKIILKNYRKKIILIDRFVDSTIAYQSGGMGLNRSIVKTLNQFVLGSIKPDFTFLFLTSPKNLRNRLNKRKKLNRYDKFKNNFYARVQKSFLSLVRKRKHIIINSNNDLKANKKIILNKLIEIIK